MDKYILAYHNINMVIDMFPFMCKESDIPEEIRLGCTYYFDDIPEEKLENINNFLKKVGVYMFENNESFNVVKINEYIFQELE